MPGAFQLSKMTALKVVILFLNLEMVSLIEQFIFEYRDFHVRNPTVMDLILI